MSNASSSDYRANRHSDRSTSRTLLRQVVVQDRDAWRRLVDNYSPLVYTWFRRAGVGPEDAEDLLQEVFAAVSKSVALFRHDDPGSTFRGWLRTIAQNKIRDFYRKQPGRPQAIGGTDACRRFLEVPAEEPHLSSAAPVFSVMFDRTLQQIRVEFRPSTWQAFWAAVIEQRSMAEVADQLGLSPAAVRQAKFKVLRRLRQELGHAAE